MRNRKCCVLLIHSRTGSLSFLPPVLRPQPTIRRLVSAPTRPTTLSRPQVWRLVQLYYLQFAFRTSTARILQTCIPITTLPRSLLSRTPCSRAFSLTSYMLLRQRDIDTISVVWSQDTVFVDINLYVCSGRSQALIS